MSGLKLVVFLACICVIKGEDFEWLPCLQKALAQGVPSLNIPSHDSMEFSYNRTWILEDLEIDVEANVMWKNIPWWMVKNYTVIDNNDKFINVEYNLFWKSFTLTSAGRVDLASPPGSTQHEYVGTINVHLTDVNWNGIVSLNKASGNTPQFLNDLSIRWTNEASEVSVNIPPLLVDTELVKDLLDAELRELSDSNYFGDSFRTYLNENWLQNANNYRALMDWCQTA